MAVPLRPRADGPAGPRHPGVHRPRERPDDPVHAGAQAGTGRPQRLQRLLVLGSPVRGRPLARPRAATGEIRPDWDLSTPGLRAAWDPATARSSTAGTGGPPIPAGGLTGYRHAGPRRAGAQGRGCRVPGASSSGPSRSASRGAGSGRCHRRAGPSAGGMDVRVLVLVAQVPVALGPRGESQLAHRAVHGGHVRHLLDPGDPLQSTRAAARSAQSRMTPHRSPRGSPRDDDGAVGVPEHGQADGAEQQAGEPAVPAGTEHEQGGTLGACRSAAAAVPTAIVVSISTAGYFSAHGATASATAPAPPAGPRAAAASCGRGRRGSRGPTSRAGPHS